MQLRDFAPEVAFSLLNNQGAGDVQTIGTKIAITGLPAFETADYIGFSKQVAVSEVTQKARLAVAGTLVASTRYSFVFGNTNTQEFGYSGVLKPIKVTTPPTLGAQATEKHNMYVKMAVQVNTDKRKLVTAYPVVTLTHAAGTFVVGETLTGATTGAKGIIIASSSGNVTVRLTTISPYKIFTGTENLDDDSGTGPFAMSGITLGVGLDLVDTGNYYDPAEKKTGVTEIRLTGGFASTDLTILTAGVYSEGQGSWLAKRVPVLERTSGNLAQGAWNMALNNAPETSSTYIKYIIQVKKNTASSVSQIGQNTTNFMNYVIWAKTTATNQAAFDSAIAAL